jgi:hypothetical protein
VSQSVRWEYMSVSYRYTREWVFPPGETVWKCWFDIYKPGKGTETRRSTDSSDPDLKDSIWWLDLLQEFGAEGWELVGETIQSWVVVDEENGWRNKRVPTHIRWSFKRPVEG